MGRVANHRCLSENRLKIEVRSPESGSQKTDTTARLDIYVHVFRQALERIGIQELTAP